MMIIYLLKSTLCLGILLLFYKWALEDVAIHKFKRGFLLFALITSVAVPFLPTGYSFTSEHVAETVTMINLIEDFTQVESTADVITLPSAGDMFLGLMLLISIVFLMNAGRNVYRLLQKASKNEQKPYKGLQLILLDEEVIPHTFLDKIYINKKEYQEGKIDDQLLAHEQAHADQKHSWDVLFIEFLICLFWFNPLLRLYKTAIQLNHEFLADAAVINQYQKVKKYQYLLLGVIKNNNQISLASSINFHLTKKRLEMMTTQSTLRQKTLLPLSIFPLVIILLIAFGRPASAQNSQNQPEISNNQKMIGERDAYFKDAIIHYKTKDGKVMVKSYNALPEYVKNMMAPPPPPPPVPGQNDQELTVPPLKKGTLISLTENGSIKIGGNGELPPPPPPKAPNPPSKVVKGSFAPTAPMPVSPPKPPKAPSGITVIGNLSPPPPPPPPSQVRHLAEQGTKIYLNDMLVKPEVAKTICEDLDSKTMKLVTMKDGTKALYITTKD